jgi:hypothetical protein
VAVMPENDRWEALYAARTRGDVGEGIAAVLGLLGVPDVISFAGGFPDPVTGGTRLARLLWRCMETSSTRSPYVLDSG